MHLLLDEMLKKTAKWLRIFGIDTEFIEGKKDSELIDYATKNNLIFITKDEELANRCRKQKINYLLLKSEKIAEQLREIKSSLALEFKFPEQTRCPSCNESLKLVDKEKVSALVPENVLKSQEKFWLCEKCRKAYWQGSHWRNITKIYEGANKILSS